MRDKKYLYLTLIIILLLAIFAISYAWFNTIVSGNDSAKINKVVTGKLELSYNDTNEIYLENAVPGDSFTKEINVKNTGNMEASYNLVWQELTNEIINDELVIEATCQRLNSSGVIEGTCESISQVPVKYNSIKRNISIESGATHKYIIKVTFIDTGSNQNYNKKKVFNGKLGIEEYKELTSVSFAEDSWKTISSLVEIGDTSNYKVGDTKEIDFGSYGTHTVRIANKSTPSGCSTQGFSQTACGFVIEFQDIITTSKMNTAYSNTGGWNNAEMNTFINNDIYNALPNELKEIIIDTIVVSSYGKNDTANFTTTNKLYLLAPKEIYTDYTETTDTAKDLTRALDYYNEKGVTMNSYANAIKYNNSTATWWWLRNVPSSNSGNFFGVNVTGILNNNYAHFVGGVSPAFRIG